MEAVLAFMTLNYSEDEEILVRLFKHRRGKRGIFV